MATPNRKIVVAPEYTSALGYAVYCFCYLEWGAIYLAETFKPGYVRTVRKKSAGQIARDLGQYVLEAPAAFFHLSNRLGNFSTDFRILVDRRNKLIHAEPYTAENNDQRLQYERKIDWTIERMNLVAREFQVASIEAGELRKSILVARAHP